MGQYWKLVNLDKREYVHPHKVGAGLKLWEQLAAYPGTGAALVVLLAAMPEQRGGGDLQLGDDVAKRTIGRWAGDRVAFVGDYAEDSDLPNERASVIYDACSPDGDYTDISEDVATVIEYELRGKFTGSGWRTFEED